MIKVRPAADRGHFNHGWLDTYHTFSFADYHDPEHMGFRSLRVINEDRVAPGKGFGTHGHRDMEIITYVLDGALKHEDSAGHSGVLRPGMVQKMSAGKGIMHSEFNASQSEPVHLLQIWIVPLQHGLAPNYTDRTLDPNAMENRLELVAAQNGGDGALPLFQDALLYAARLASGKAIHYDIDAGRFAWVQVARGVLDLNGVALNAGDGAAVNDESSLEIASREDAEFLLFDLA